MGVNINTECFIKKCKAEGLFEKQTDIGGVEFLLDKMRTDKRLKDWRHAVYMFATIKSETAHTFMPIEEMDNKAGTYLKAKKYYPYYGRGYVQLTWKSSYAKYSKVLGVDLVNNVDLARDPNYAYEIMSVGMLDKPTFTGVNLRKYIYGNTTDYFNARRVINGTSGAAYFEKLALRFHPIVESCLQADNNLAGIPLGWGLVAAGIGSIILFRNRKGKKK